MTVFGCTVWLQPTLLLQWRVWCPPTQVQAGPLIRRTAVSPRHDKGQTETWPGRTVLCRGELCWLHALLPRSNAGSPREVGHRRWVLCRLCMCVNIWKIQTDTEMNERALVIELGVLFILWKMLECKKLLENINFYNIWILGLHCAYIWCLFVRACS